MMEVFSRMLQRVEGAGLIRGFKADGRRGGGNVFHISCLQKIQFYFVM